MRALQLAKITTACTALALAISGTAIAAEQEADQTKGLDVSNHNGSVDWKKVAADGQKFAFVLATDGEKFTNDLFGKQYSGARDAGLLTGAYHFGRPDGSATNQAERFLKTANYHNDGKTLPPVLDLEPNPADHGCYGKSAEALTEWTKTFAGKVKESTGRDPIIYTGQGFWDKCMSNTKSFKEKPLWVASWGVDKPETPGGWENWTFWQYDDKGSVDGVSGKVDVDKFNGSLDDLKKFASGR